MRKLKSKRKKRVSTIDPFCNIASRKQMVIAKQNQLNQAPDNPDEQPMVKKLVELIKTMPSKQQHQSKKKGVKRLQQDAGTKKRLQQDAGIKETGGKKARKRKQKAKQLTQQEEEDAKLTFREEQRKQKLTRHAGESDKKFLRRIRHQADKDIRDQMDQIKLLGKHEPDVLDEVGKKEVSSREKERSEKLKVKKKSKKIEKKLDVLEEQFFKDKVEFGDVAARPPELSFQPRKSQPSNTAGQRKLLLTSLMDKPPKSTSSHAAKGSVQKKTRKHKYKKRKDMDNSEKRRFDSMRNEAILAYRQAKAEAMAQRTSNP